MAARLARRRRRRRRAGRRLRARARPRSAPRWPPCSRCRRRRRCARGPAACRHARRATRWTACAGGDTEPSVTKSCDSARDRRSVRRPARLRARPAEPAAQPDLPVPGWSAQVARRLRRRAARAAPAPAARVVGARAAPKGRAHLGGLRRRTVAPALRRTCSRAQRPRRMRARCAWAAAPAITVSRLGAPHSAAFLPRGCQCRPAPRFISKIDPSDTLASRTPLSPTPGRARTPGT